MRNPAIVILPAILLLCSLCYLPGLSGGFAFDDYTTILRNTSVINAEVNLRSLADVAWSGGVAGQFRRPIPMLSFAANTIVSGSSPLGFKVTNLLIHLCNGVLLYLLLRVLFRRAFQSSGSEAPLTPATILAFTVTAIWLVHPINLTTVLYVVQRMTSIAALFSLAGMLAYCYGRERQLLGAGGNISIYFITPLCLILGVLSKENAVLVPALIALIESCFYRFRASSIQQRKCLVVTYIFCICFLLIGGLIYFSANPGWLAERYEYRSFTVTERLMTEARVIWFYVSMIALPRLPEFALYHDDILLSSSLIEPLATSFSIASLLVVLIIAVIAIKREPIITFGVLWFLIGHSLESTVIPLDIVHEHRNYLPSIGLFFLMFGVLGRMTEKYSVINKYLPLITILPILLMAGLTTLRASAWSDPVTLANTEAQNHPRSFRSVYASARVQLEYYRMRGEKKDKELAIERLKTASQLDNESTLPFIALVRLARDHDKEQTLQWSTEIKRRLRFKLTTMPEASALGALVACHRERSRCPISTKDLAEYYYAALGNENLRPSVKAILLSDFALFNVNTLGDFPLALSLAEEAVELKPNYSAYRELLIRLLILGGRVDQARRQLDELSVRRFWDDRIKVSNKKIVALQKAIDEAINTNEQHKRI